MDINKISPNQKVANDIRGFYLCMLDDRNDVFYARMKRVSMDSTDFLDYSLCNFNIFGFSDIIPIKVQKNLVEYTPTERTIVALMIRNTDNIFVMRNAFYIWGV